VCEPKIKKIDIKVKADQAYLDETKKQGFNVLITRSVGLDHIDVKYAKKIGVEVYGLNKYHEHSTAEHYWNLLFRLVRPLNKLPGTELFGKTLLIIGKGKVGKLLVKQGKAFGLKVLTYDIIDGQTKRDLNKLLGIAQIIFMCVPLTKNTKHMLDVKEFLKMKHTPWIVNAARTELIDLDMADWALYCGYIKGYAVDDKITHTITVHKKTKQFINCRQHMGSQTTEAQQKADKEIETLEKKINKKWRSKK